MLPSNIEKIIKNSEQPLCIDALRGKCSIHISHRDVVMSDDFFPCRHCGVDRHYVKKLSPLGRIRVLFRFRDI